MIQQFIYDYMGVPLSYDLTTSQILGQKFVKFFVGILVQIMTHFEINWPLVIDQIIKSETNKLCREKNICTPNAKASFLFKVPS